MYSKNFSTFGKIFEVEFSDHVTSIIGPNGSGKSQGCGLEHLMVSIEGMGVGKRFTGDRPRFIGQAGKSADCGVILKDTSTDALITINNHMTGAANNITIKSDKPDPIDESLLASLLNVSLMSSKFFSGLSSIEQTKALGIDTSTFDANIKRLKEEAKALRAQIAVYGDIQPGEPIEKIDIGALEIDKKLIAGKLNEIYIANKNENNRRRSMHFDKKELAQKEQSEKIEKARIALEEMRFENDLRQDNINTAKEYLDFFINHGYSGNELLGFINSMPQPQPVLAGQFDVPAIPSFPDPVLIDPEIPDGAELVAIDEKIKAANEQNTLAKEYEAEKKRFDEKTVKEKALDDNLTKQGEEVTARNFYMSGRKFGFDGLATNEDGELLLNDRPIKIPYYSTGQLIIIVAKLYASLNPLLKTIFIDDFDLLDDENQDKILDELKDFQIITMEVRKIKDRENMITLRECKVVIDEEEKGKSLI